MACPFCDLQKSRIIYAGENIFVIYSNPRLMKDHLLVIPKRHVEKLSELNEEEKKELIEITIRFQEKLLKKYPGCDIRQHYRPFIPQSQLSVNHLHVHLQPRKFKDELYEKCQKYETDIFQIKTYKY